MIFKYDPFDDLTVDIQFLQDLDAENACAEIP